MPRHIGRPLKLPRDGEIRLTFTPGRPTAAESANAVRATGSGDILATMHEKRQKLADRRRLPSSSR